jgi:hypothetical protein
MGRARRKRRGKGKRVRKEVMERREEKPGKRKGRDRAWEGQGKRGKKDAKRRVWGREELREGKRKKGEREGKRREGKRDKPHNPNDMVGKKCLPDYVGVTDYNAKGLKKMIGPKCMFIE